TNYRKEQECTDFIVKVPVTWDETRVLAAQTGDFIVVARRHGKDWYLAGMTDWTRRTLEADLSFLAPGNFTLEYFADGINADRRGEDYIRSTRNVTATDKIDIPMAPGGGWVARIISQ
ncbi:MAG TPA: glycoside hydrolase family 97 C-terminal domain-containing protein, partial [Bacteroidales bacterium]|nr:glycoside hydrolase family 97 C-terminal domain-containing protein [Bacteroidales bacterium]